MTDTFDNWLSGFGDPSWQNTGTVGGGAAFPDVAPVPPSGPIVDQDMANNIIRVANELGISPQELATVVSYETAGTFDKWKAGPRTQWGQHRGLIQWGEPQAAKYGVTAETSIADQLDAVARYLRDAGVKPGMGLLDIYSAVNAGRVGRYNASDANNGGAPGTVADKVRDQMEGHKIKAALLLGGKWSPESGIANNAMAPRPSIAKMAQSGGLGPLPYPDQVPGVDPTLPAPAGVSPAAAQLQSMVSPSATDEGSPPLPDPSEFGDLYLSNGMPVPFVNRQSTPTWLETVSRSARDLSMGAGKFVGDLANQTLRNTGQVAAKAQGTLTSLPFMLGASVPAIGAALGNIGGGEPSQTDAEGNTQYSRKSELTKLLEGATQTLVGEGAKQQERADFMYGASGQPQDVGEKVGAAIGRNALGGHPLLVAAGTGIELGAPYVKPALDALVPPAQAKYTRQQLIDMGMMKTAEENAMLPGPRVSRTIYNTPAGPMDMPENSFATLGVIGAATLGFAFGPKVISAIRHNPKPTFRPVQNAAPGTVAVSSPGDLAKVYHDVYAPLISVGKKFGVTPQVLQDLESAARIQSGSAARNLVHTAMQLGHMETPTFRFKVPVPMSKIVEGTQGMQYWDDYLKAMALRDEVLFKQNQLAARRSAKNYSKPVPTQTVATEVNETKQLGEILRTISNIERTPEGPAIKQAFKHYQENIKESRTFLSDGEFGILSGPAAKELNRNFKGSMVLDRSRRNVVVDKLQLGEKPLALAENQMHALMRKRMENEVNGMYIDAVRARNPDAYVKVDKDWMKAHGRAARQAGTLVTIYRRGVKEHYTTDPLLASIHRLDPYYYTGGISETFYASKKFFESATTGALAPFFVPTSAIRSYQIAKLNAGQGRAPTLFGTMMAVPRQLGPQVAGNKTVQAMADRLDSATGGWLSSVAGPTNHQALSKTLDDYYQNSFYMYMQRSGGHQGSFLQASNLQQTRLDKLLSSMAPGWGKDFVHAWKQMLDSGHNAAAFAYARRNKDKWLAPELGMRARALTGDPVRTGQAYINNRKEPIRFQADGMGQAIGERAARGYGWITEQGRNAVPWWNITTQGMRQVGRMYMENPIKFTSMVWLTQMAPTAALYGYAKALGPEYVEYMMDGRSPYAFLMNHYVPIPGLPPHKGAEIPRIHEFSFFNAMMMKAMDHAFGRPIKPQTEDWQAVAKSFVGLMDPPMPPLMNLPFAAAQQVSGTGVIGTTVGQLAPMLLGGTGSPFGGEVYKKRQEPFDQLGGMNATAEMMMRALAPGITDIVASSYVAASHDPSIWTKIPTGIAAGAKRGVEKAPIVRDVIGWKPPATGNTQINAELLAKSKAIRNLSDYYSKNIKNAGQINVQPQSGAGGAVARSYLGDGLPVKPSNETYKTSNRKTGAVAGQAKPGQWADRVGLKQPEPTNPLFKMFAERLIQKFGSDEPAKGGFGYKSMWRMYGDMTESLRTLSKTSDGNSHVWALELSQKPELLAWLKDQKVDTKNPREVRNFLTLKRADYAKKMLFAIRAVEDEFNSIPRIREHLGGQRFDINDMDPYGGPGIQNEGPDFDPSTMTP